MNAFAILLMAAITPVDHQRTYLASIVAIPIKKDDGIESFSFDTWGVQFDAVCKIPAGWRIKAGSYASPDGTLEGEASLGVTWFRESTPKGLQSIALITLYGPVQHKDIRSKTGVVPATFKGTVTLWNDDRERKVSLTSRNIRLVPARRCPS